MQHALGWFAVASIVLSTAPASAREVDFKVVVSEELLIYSISAKDLSRLFLLRQSKWADGTPAAPVDKPLESAVRQSFTKAIHGRSVNSVKNFWQGQIFKGKSAPPPEMQSDREVLRFVARRPGALGYVAAETPLPHSVKVLEVSDLAGYDAAALTEAGGYEAWSDYEAEGDYDAWTDYEAASHDADEPDDEAPLADEVLSSHGDLRLLLTGSCGADGDGREAVLENGNPYDALRAQLEVSVWADGWFRSSSVVAHTIGPHDEKRLGCTAGSGKLETRYSIVHVSSVASYEVAHHGHDGPPRSAVDIVGSGTCGSGRQGTGRSLLNKHPRRAMAVSVRYQETRDGNLRKRYEKTYVLEPGASRWLGCSRDGSIARRFTILKASYSGHR